MMMFRRAAATGLRVHGELSAAIHATMGTPFADTHCVQGSVVRYALNNKGRIHAGFMPPRTHAAPHA